MEFRVSVCLTRFFNDERSYCYIYLDKSYKNVAALEQHLRWQFRLPNNFCLMTNNNLLPSDQPAKIIQIGDMITVVPLQKDWREQDYAIEPTESDKNGEVENGPTEVIDVAGSEKISKKKKKKKSKPETAEPSVSALEEPVLLKQEEEHSPEDAAENDSDKKKDSDMDVSMGSDVDRDIEQVLNDDYIERNEQVSKEKQSGNDNGTDMEPHKMPEMQMAIQQLKLKALTLLNEVASQKPVAGVSGGRINKRKRIRKRNKNPSLSVSTPDLSDSGSAAPLTFKPVKKSSSHIRFDNDQPAIAIRNSEITTKPRIIHAIESNSNLRRTSICASPSSDNVRCTSSPNLYPSTNETMNGSGKTDMQLSKEPMIRVENVKKRLPEFPVMDDVYPVPKDLILFKMLKMGNDYTPSFSDFILANVLEVDKAGGFVKLSIVDGHKECMPASGKFDLEPKEELSTSDELIIDVSWNQVTEPRLIFP